MSRLDEAMQTVARFRRWNVRTDAFSALVCENDHDKGDDCQWRELWPREFRELREASVVLLAELEHRERRET